MSNQSQKNNQVTPKKQSSLRDLMLKMRLRKHFSNKKIDSLAKKSQLIINSFQKIDMPFQNLKNEKFPKKNFENDENTKKLSKGILKRKKNY